MDSLSVRIKTFIDLNNRTKKKYQEIKREIENTFRVTLCDKKLIRMVRSFRKRVKYPCECKIVRILIKLVQEQRVTSTEYLQQRLQTGIQTELIFLLRCLIDVV